MNWQPIDIKFNLLEDKNSLKSQMVNNTNTDAHLFLINGTNHLIWLL